MNTTKLQKQYKEVFSQYQEILKTATIVEEVIKGKQEHLTNLVTLLPLKPLKEREEVRTKAVNARSKLLIALQSYYKGERYKEKIIKTIIYNLISDNKETENYFKHVLKFKKNNILYKLIQAIPLGANSCYFCFTSLSCATCSYATFHKECDVSHSDYASIKVVKLHLQSILFAR